MSTAVKFIAIRRESRRRTSARMLYNAKVAAKMNLVSQIMRHYERKVKVTHMDFLFGCTLQERVLSSSTLTQRTMYDCEETRMST